MGKSLDGKELGTGIIQKKNGRYEARYIDRFGKRVSISGTDLKDVKKRYNESMYLNEKELNVQSDITLDSWYLRWMADYKKGCVRENTIRHYKIIYEKHIYPVLGKKKLTDIRQIEINHMIKDMKGKGYSWEVRNKIKILLIDMYNKAIINEYANKNPAKGVYVGNDEKKEPRALSVEEQEVFMERAKGSFYDNLFVVALNSGLRLGELAALKWEDIDLEKRIIKVTKTLVYAKYEDDDKKTFHFELPKTKTSIRNVPINNACELALKKQYLEKNVVCNKMPSQKQVPDEFRDLLFTTTHNTPIESQIMRQAIKVILDDVNYKRDYIEEIAPFGMHIFRHTFATRAFESGIQPKVIQGYLGHATLAMTMDLYAKLLPEHMQNEMEKLDMALVEIEKKNEMLIEEKFQNAIDDEKKIVSFRGDSMVV